MSPWRESLLILGLIWSFASTSAQWKSLPLTGSNPGLDKNSAGQKESATIEHFRRIHGAELERRAAETVPGKPEEEGFDGMTHDDMTHGMTQTGVVGVEMENMDTSEHLKTDEQSESFQTGKRQRRREKTSGRRWRQNGANILGRSETSERGGTIKRGENGLGFRGRQLAGEKQRRRWGVNTLSVWGKKRSDREKENGEGGGEQEADDTSEGRSRPEADGSKPEMTRNGANDGGSHDDRLKRQRNRRSIGDIDEDSEEPSVDCYPAAAAAAAEAAEAVSYLSKRSKPRRRSLPAPYDGPKRTWETNTMKVWGKRSGGKPTWEEYFHHNADQPIGGKRKWTSNNAIRIWGKRDRVPPPHDEENFPFSRLYVDAYES